jgi:hypothetical protein
MSIFGTESTPEDFVPAQDTTNELAEQEYSEPEEQPEFEAEQEEQYEEHSEEEQTDPEGHSDELIAGKFKSQEDLINAYKNLERKLHAPQQQQQPTQQQQQSQMWTEDQRDAVINAFNNDPIGTINYFAQQAVTQAVNPLQQERAFERTIANIEKVAQSYAQVNTEDGMSQLMTRVNEIAQDFGNPNLAKAPTPRVLEMAARELWGNTSTAQLYQQAKAAGRQEAEAARRAKTGLAAPSNIKPKQAPRTTGDSIRDGILAASRNSGLFG